MINMACPYRHREVSAEDILNMSMTDCYNIEKSVAYDLSTYER